MIIQKPYTVLVKNFKLIHWVLFFLIVFLITKSLSIYSFFTSYVENKFYVVSETLASQYVGIAMFIIALLLAISSLLIYLILKFQHKNSKIYLLSFLFYAGLFMYFISMRSVFKNLEISEFLNIESVKAYKDFSLIIIIPQLIFLFVTLGRGLGFNLKQFDFKKDIEDLNIEVSEEDEVELTLGFDTYKIARFFRKFLRLTKYFFVENKVFVILLCIIFAGVIGVISLKNVDFDKTFKTSVDKMLIDGIRYSTGDSFYTQRDIYGKNIEVGKYYLLVEVNMHNITVDNKELTREMFRLVVNGNLIFPELSMNDKFMDLGKIFTTTKLNSGVEETYYVVFEVPEDSLEDEYTFKIKNNINYVDILVKPKSLDYVTNAGDYNTIPQSVTFTDDTLNGSILNINSYFIKNKFNEKYEYKVGNVVKEGTYTIMPKITSKGNQNIIRLEMSLGLNPELFITKYITKTSDLINYYGYLRYGNDVKTTTIKLNPVETNFSSDKYIYSEIPAEAEKAEKIDLILIIRDKKYTINLKKGI